MIYYNQERECASRETITSLQNEGLRKTVSRIYEQVPHYQQKMKEKGVTPDDIKSINDLHKLPFITKEDLRVTYPYGFLSVPLSDCVRIQSTSGTTGKRVLAFYTQHDIDLWEECCARAIVAAGGSKDDVCQIAYGYGLFTGGAGLNGGSHKVGCLTLPMSTGSTDRQIQFMCDLGTTILCCTPSYAAYIADTIEEMGIRDKVKLKAGIFGAEAWSNSMRRDIENRLGIKAYDIYGLTELSGPGISFDCSEQTGLHINEDHFIAEIIDPETGETLGEGEEGELVLTTVDKEAFPIVRYRTKDITRLIYDKCKCGRTFVRMEKTVGRSDDMLIVKGVNVFPSQIETVLLNMGYPPNYQIIVTRESNSDKMEVLVEMTSEMFSDSVSKITAREKALVANIKSMLGIYASVRLVQPKSMDRNFDGKVKRIIDKRLI